MLSERQEQHKIFVWLDPRNTVITTKDQILKKTNRDNVGCGEFYTFLRSQVSDFLAIPKMAAIWYGAQSTVVERRFKRLADTFKQNYFVHQKSMIHDSDRLEIRKVTRARLPGSSHNPHDNFWCQPMGHFRGQENCERLAIQIGVAWMELTYLALHSLKLARLFLCLIVRSPWRHSVDACSSFLVISG